MFKSIRVHDSFSKYARATLTYSVNGRSKVGEYSLNWDTLHQKRLDIAGHTQYTENLKTLLQTLKVTKVVIYLTEEMDKRIEDAFYQTWSAVAPDVQQIEGWKDTPSGIAEMVYDADRMTMFGNDEEATKAFDNYLKTNFNKGIKWCKTWAKRFC